MFIQSVGNSPVPSVQSTSTSINAVQNETSNNIVAEDTVSISSEALKMASEVDLEQITASDYVDGLSEFETNSLLASVESKLKPDYFSGADEYNTNVAAEAAAQLLAEAESQGLELNLDETVNYIQRKCHIDTSNAIDEAIKMGWLDAPTDDGLDLKVIDPVDNLSEKDKAILKAMYNDLNSKGLPTGQIDIIADMLGILRSESSTTSTGEAYSMSTEFLAALSNGINEEGAWPPGLDSETLSYLIDNISEYTS